MNLATTSVYLLSPAPTKTVVRAPRLIARASTKSGTGSVQGLQAQSKRRGRGRGRGLLPLSFAAFLFPSCEGAKWHSKEWIVNFVVVIAAALSASFFPSLPLPLFSTARSNSFGWQDMGSVENVFPSLFIRSLNLRL